jgi:N-acetylneuraminic acid mutarotase
VKKADMPTARHSLATSVADGKIYAIGGFDRSWCGLKAVEVYDPVMDSWIRKADMPSARGMLSSCVVDGVIYAVGGAPDLSFAYPVVEAYDPQTDSWDSRANPSTLRVSLSTTGVDGIVYAFGGIVWQKNDGSWISTSEVTVYDPAIDTWTKKTDMSSPRYGFSSCICGGRIYLIGGDDEGYTAFSIVEEYEYQSEMGTVSGAPSRPR